MSAHEDKQPFSESNLESPAYRARLKRKLDCLIAVLEVAGAKVRRSLAAPQADVERLVRIEKNLQETLRVCQRARRALERREAIPSDLKADLSKVVGSQGIALPEEKAEEPPQRARGNTRGMVIEMSSAEEYERFRELNPLDPAEIGSVDMDELCRRLGGA